MFLGNGSPSFHILSELLKTLAVIEYNGERWCGVHPVLVDFLREKGRINA